MDRIEIARRWMAAKGSRAKATLAAVEEVIADDIVTPTAIGKAEVLEAVRTAKGAFLFSKGAWSEPTDDGETVRATCTFAEDAPYHRADVAVRINAEGLITHASTTTHLTPEGPLDAVIARVWGPRRGMAGLPAHLEEQYGITVKAIEQLDNGVMRVDRADGDPWVARVFPADRSVASVRGDAAVLALLEKNDYPAERCAADEPVTTMEGQGVLVTEFVAGKTASQSLATWRRLADLLGRLHAMPGGSKAVKREAGALHLYTIGGSIREELETAAACMDSIAGIAGASVFASDFSMVRKQLDVADDFSDLPRGLIHTDFHPRNVVAAQDGTLMPIDWALAGHGPRVVSFGIFALGIGAKGSVNTQRLEAIVKAYREHITLEPEELDRLADALLHRQLIFEAYGQCLGVVTKQKTWGMGAWLNDRDLCAEIAAQLRRAFTA